MPPDLVQNNYARVDSDAILDGESTTLKIYTGSVSRLVDASRRRVAHRPMMLLIGRLFKVTRCHFAFEEFRGSRS
jgi:hypothetical protein